MSKHFPHCTKTVWVTKDGRRIPVKDMDGQHIVNTYNMLIRWAQRQIDVEVGEAYAAMAHCRGDGALMACEQQAAWWDRTGAPGYCHVHVAAFPAIEKRYRRIVSGEEKIDHRVYAF